MAMTVKDLIQKLKSLPENSLVLVDGDEGGYSDVKNLKNIKVKLNVEP